MLGLGAKLSLSDFEKLVTAVGFTLAPQLFFFIIIFIIFFFLPWLLLLVFLLIFLLIFFIFFFWRFFWSWTSLCWTSYIG